MKKRASMGVMAIALAFGVAVSGSGCTNTDPRLNGTWEGEAEGVLTRLVFDNGNFITEVYSDGFLPATRGTFTTSENTIAKRATHLHRRAFEQETGPEWLDRSAAAAILHEKDVGGEDAREIDAVIDVFFLNTTSQFILIADSLSLTTTVSASELARLADAFGICPSSIDDFFPTSVTQEFIRRN